VPEGDARPSRTASWWRRVRPLVVAHRGATDRAPENTLAAFEAAAEGGADVIELDVQLTADGVPVVLHDERLDRTTPASGAVRTYTWEKIRSLDAGSWYSPAFAGEPIPRLDDVVAWASDHDALLLVELKTSPVYDLATADALAKLFGASNHPGVILYASDHILVSDLARRLPQIARGVIVNEHTPFVNDMSDSTGADLLSQSTWSLTPQTAREAHQRGRLVSAEARSASDVLMLGEWGVDLIVSTKLTLTELTDLVHETRRSATGKPA
jgi:glycerophosphoryl diester phosphodiesterase